MKNGYNVLRIGGLNIAASRFLDFLRRDEIKYMTIVDFEQNSKYINDLYKTAEFFNCRHLLKKLNVQWIKTDFGQKVFRRLLRRFYLPTPYKFSFKMIALELMRVLNLNNYDLIWVGDNDFDDSNLLFYFSHKLIGKKKSFIRSYKETRFRKKWTEEYMLKNSGALIFPCSEYIDFFNELYSFRPRNVHIADIDWRYSKLIDFVKTIDSKKLSFFDGKPHVCLLTGRALSDPSEKRSGFRYYFVPIVKELVKRGIFVHMHTFGIVPSKKYGNVYEQIAKETELFRIEKPLDLTAYSGDYRILKQYDAGILHSLVPSSITDLHEFQKINIPNRLYEYQIADVVPITPKQALPAVEKIIQQTDFGIIYDNYDDLTEKLKDLVKGNLNSTIQREKISDFGNFSDIFLKIVEERKNVNV